MIARVFKAWTTPQLADKYEQQLREQFIPRLHEIVGYQGSYILRHDTDVESVFLLVHLFDTLDAVQAFAGSEYALPVHEPAVGRPLIARSEPFATHYDVKLAP